MVLEAGRSLTQGLHFGMGTEIGGRDWLVPAFAHNLPSGHHNGPDWNFTFLLGIACQFQCRAHITEVSRGPIFPRSELNSVAQNCVFQYVNSYFLSQVQARLLKELGYSS